MACSVPRASGSWRSATDTVCDSLPASLPHDGALQGLHSGSAQSRRFGRVCPAGDAMGPGRLNAWALLPQCLSLVVVRILKVPGHQG